MRAQPEEIVGIGREHPVASLGSRCHDDRASEGHPSHTPQSLPRDSGERFFERLDRATFEQRRARGSATPAPNFSDDDGGYRKRQAAQAQPPSDAGTPSGTTETHAVGIADALEYG